MISPCLPGVGRRETGSGDLAPKGPNRPAQGNALGPLAAAEERRRRNGPRDDSYELRPFNNLFFGESAARIEVRRGAVKRVAPLASLRPDPTTIDDLFRMIHRADANGKDATIEARGPAGPGSGATSPGLRTPTRGEYSVRAGEQTADPT